MTLYETIGADFISQAIEEFYTRAVEDPLIGHFFFKVDIDSLVAKQILFSSRLLGLKTKHSKDETTTRSLKAVHAPLRINAVHFARRQKLLENVLSDLGLSKDLRTAWLSLEGQLKSSIVQNAHTCLD